MIYKNIKFLENHIATLNKLNDETSTNKDHLATYRQWLNSYANHMSGKQENLDKALSEYTGKTVQKGVQMIKQAVANNMIGLNLGTAMTNFIASTTAFAKTNKLASAQALPQMVANIVRDDGLLDKSKFFTNRMGSESIAKSKYKKIVDFGYIFMKATDKMTAEFVLRSKYNDYKIKGYSDENAMRKADLFATKLMAGRTAPELPVVFSSKTLGLFTQFQLEAVNQMDVLFKDTFGDDYSSEQKNIKNVKAYNTMRALTTFAQLLAFSYLFNNVYEDFAGRRPAFDILGFIEGAFKHFTNPNISKTDASIKNCR